MKRKFLIFLCFFFSSLLLAILFLFATEKGHDLRRFAAATILSTQHQHWAKWTFLPQEELDELLENIKNPKFINTILSPHLGEDEHDPNTSKTGKRFPSASDELVVEVETIEKRNNPASYFKGKVMTISNPHNVKLRSSSMSDYGEQIFTIAERVGAIAATNASGFHDPSGNGNGGTPLGLIFEDGERKTNNKNDYVAALTKSGQLITGKYTADELENAHVISAAGFKPQLISNGKKMITEGDGGWGAGPRTAMGQTKDGKIILVVIDGRQPSRSIGATMKEVQDILYDRGAINAMAMDGGSSASMYLNGDNITTPSSVGNIPRYLPNIWAVIPKKGQKVKVIHDGETIINTKHYGE